MSNLCLLFHLTRSTHQNFEINPKSYYKITQVVRIELCEMIVSLLFFLFSLGSIHLLLFSSFHMRTAYATKCIKYVFSCIAWFITQPKSNQTVLKHFYKQPLQIEKLYFLAMKCVLNVASNETSSTVWLHQFIQFVCFFSASIRCIDIEFLFG